MFAYPPQAKVNRRLPKNAIYKNAKPSKAVKKLFISQVSEIVWKYKLSRGTINMAPKDGYSEIQVFEIILKEPELNRKVLVAIDKAIPYPIFYRLQYQDRINRVAAYKHPGQADKNKWMTGIYFETGWKDATPPESKLPIALDLKSLYERMMLPYIGFECRSGETLGSLVERVQLIRKKQRELKALKGKMAKERQFNRKVDFNSRIRNLETELTALTNE